MSRVYITHRNHVGMRVHAERRRVSVLRSHMPTILPAPADSRCVCVCASACLSQPTFQDEFAIIRTPVVVGPRRDTHTPLIRRVELSTR